VWYLWDHTYPTIEHKSAGVRYLKICINFAFKPTRKYEEVFIIIFLSRVRSLACSDFTVAIYFLNVPHLFYVWDYNRRRSSELMIDPFLVNYFPIVPCCYQYLQLWEWRSFCVFSLLKQLSLVQPLTDLKHTIYAAITELSSLWFSTKNIQDFIRFYCLVLFFEVLFNAPNVSKLIIFIVLSSVLHVMS